MHAELMTLPYTRNKTTVPVAELCVYNSVQWELYLTFGPIRNPGFLFSIILN
jgi:hypothetical protein